NGECGEYDGGRQPQLLESHDRRNSDHEEPQCAAEQAGGWQTGGDGREQRGTPDKVAHQKAQREYQQSQQRTWHEPEELLDQPLKWSELERIERRDNEPDPDDPEDDFGDEQLGAR